MFNNMHGRGCGPKDGRGGGRMHRGPFSMRWEVHRHGGAGRGEGGRSRRMFDGGELRLVLLELIADEPRHGYDLIRRIEELTGGAYAPSPGIVYPTITLLDDMGMIEEQKTEGAKKLFAVTPAGTAELNANREQVDALMARLSALGEERERTESTSIRRAMGNLREVLVNRLRHGEVDPETVHAIVAEIDAAAQKIERL